MKEKIEQIRQQALAAIEDAAGMDKLNDVKVAFLGKKGQLSSLLKGMKDVAPEDRPKVGQMVNEARAGIEEKMEEKRTAIQKKLREEKMKKEVIDVTLPGKKVAVGHRHPNQIALDDLERVFIGMGYEVVEGPEVEYDHYNFELLNIPAIIRQRTSRILSTLQKISFFVHRHHRYRHVSWKQDVCQSALSLLDEYSVLTK